MDFRKYILTRISEARKEYFRLKKEIAELQPTLPKGTYLSNYTSNSKASKREFPSAPYIYYCLSHKKGVLPSAKNNNKPTYKHHLGRLENHRYIKGILALEKMQLLAIKQETLGRIEQHLYQLKNIYKEYKLMPKEDKEAIMLDDKILEHDPLDRFL